MSSTESRYRKMCALEAHISQNILLVMI